MNQVKVKWRRHPNGDGSSTWTTTINGTHVIIANMQGQSVRFTGLGMHTLVFTSKYPDKPYDIDRVEVNREFGVNDAKRWALKEYGNAAVG